MKIHTSARRTALILVVLGLMVGGLLLANGKRSRAATPTGGTLTDTSGTLTYTAGPFVVANPTAQAGDGPICGTPATPCDDYMLTVGPFGPGFDPSNYRVKVTIQWPVSAADFDVYILQGNTVVTTAASSSDPEIASFPATAGTYTIRTVPFAPAGQSFTGTVELVQNPPPPPVGAGVVPRYQNYPGPLGTGAESSGEPSIGVDWNPNVPALKHDQVNTGGVVFYTSNLNEYRVNFDDCSSPARFSTAPATNDWEDVTFFTESQTTLDPIGFVDRQTGRVFQSQLAGASSLIAFSDTDGNSWMQSQGSGQPAGVDHQTVGGGPYNETATPPPVHPLYPNATYYCSQDIATAFCARSDDGGQTFGPGIPIYTLTQCGGLHGHIRVAPDGTAYVPNKGCGGAQGVSVSTDNGVTWTVRTVPGSLPGDTDPSVSAALDSTVYLGYQNGDGHPHIAVSHDRGLNWTDRDVSAGLIQNCVFPEVIAGDGGANGRAAFAFLGTPTGGNYQDAANFTGIWHLYIATTFDGGDTYLLADATPNDPVQIGSICTSGTTCGDDRNLLDFNDIAVDKEGRVVVGYADGCVAPGCTTTSAPGASRSALGTVTRQSGGRRLFAAFDPPAMAAPAAPRVNSAIRSAAGVTVSWDEPDNGGSPITNYKVFRGPTSGSETLLATVPANVTKYLDTTAAANTQYFYRVTAVNGVGESSFCGEVSVTGAGPTESACTLPGLTIVTDPTGDQTGNPANTQLDIQKVSAGEPFLNSCTGQLVFTMKVADLSVVPPQARWTIFFTRSTGATQSTEYFVDMTSDDTGNPTGVAFHYGHTEAGTGGVRTQSTDGLADTGSAYSPDGTITIIISNSKLTFNANPPPATLPPPAGGTAFSSINGITQQTIGVLLARIDDTGNGSYTLVGNRSCQPNNAPLAVLAAAPTTGNAPLPVNFDATTSSDADLCDTIASYTFDFGDGTAPVTQATPTITHTYTTAGNYRATLTVTDSRGMASNNGAGVNVEVAPPATPVGTGDMIISEFRLRGAGGATDEFIELYNRTASAIVVGGGGGGGWALAANVNGTPTIIATIPDGTSIPARGHYLLVNNTNPGGYTLDSYAPPDQTYTTDIPDDTGIAIFATATTSALTSATPLDAVGFGATAPPYSEGTPLPAIGANDGQYSFVRNMALTGLPKDTGNNAADFSFVSTNGGIYNSVQSTLGPPAPENTLSPIQRNAQIKTSVIDPQCSGASNDSTTACARTRDTTPVANGALGTLSFRRRFTNKTGQPVTKLRFRFVDITTKPAVGVADLRVISSSNITVTRVDGTQMQVQGTTLETTPAQPLGGGLNTALVVTLAGSLGVNAPVDVQLVAGVQTSGSFRFLVNVEALNGTPALAAPGRTSTKGVMRSSKAH